MKLSIDLFIFDFDGVIIDSAADIANAMNYALQFYNRPQLAHDEIISYIGHGAESLIRSCFAGCSEEILKEALPFYRQHYLNNAVVDTSLYTGVKETLDTIKYVMINKKTALVTNKPESITHKILEDLNIKQYFDLIMAPESLTKMKPDPEGINRVLNTFGLSAEKTIMVGDSDVDIEAGKRAGTYTCGAYYGLGNKEQLIKAGPDIIIKSMPELLNYIEIRQ